MQVLLAHYFECMVFYFLMSCGDAMLLLLKHVRVFINVNCKNSVRDFKQNVWGRYKDVQNVTEVTHNYFNGLQSLICVHFVWPPLSHPVE